MATDTAQLVVALEARLDRFEKQMRDAGEAAEQGVNRIERGFRSANQRLERAGADLGRAVVTGIAQGIGQRLADAINPARFIERLRAVGDELERIQRLGEETRLGSSNIRSLEFAGVGIGLQSSEVTQALRHFSEQSKKTRDDAEELYTALRRIGSTFATEFANASTQEERFNVVIRAMRATTDEVRLAQLSLQAFNTDNERFIALLRSSENGLEGFRNAARQAGLNLDEAMIQRGAEAARAINQFTSAINDQLKPALVELLPAINALIPPLTALIREFGYIAQTNFVSIGSQTTEALQRRLTADLAQLEDLQRSGRDVSESLTRRIQEIRAELAGREGGPQRPVVTITGNRRAFRPRPSLSSSGGDDDSESRTAFDRAVESQERANAAQRAEIEAIGLTEAARQRLLIVRRLETIAVQANTQAGEDNTAVTDEQRAAIERVANAYTEAATRLHQLQTAQRQSLELQRFLGQEMVSSISGLISGTAKLSDVVGKLAQRFAEAALQAAILGQGPLAGLFGTAPTTSGGVGGLIGAIFGALTPRAAGGPVSANSPYLVGERGPELFIPGRSGMILPNSVTRGVGNQVSVALGPFDFRGADPGSEARIRGDIARLQAQIPALVVKTVQDAQSNRILRR